MGALLLHLLIFLMVATWIVYQPPAAQPDLSIRTIAQATENVVPPPPVPSPVPQINPTAVISGLDTPAPIQGSFSGFALPIGPIDFTAPDAPVTNAASSQHVTVGVTHGLSPEREKLIYDMQLRYRTPDQIRRHEAVGTFPVYVAAYAGGDWACNTRLDKDGNIVAGSIPDLLAKINEWSNGKIRGQVVPKPLEIGSNDLIDQMPPFIFFTGHKDFVLTDQEIANLRDYLQGGGLIWGDNALAGEGSRFDVAFHREMVRVVGNHAFEAMTTDHDLFKKGRFVISEIPPGINYHADPLEHLDLDGAMAILYTPNDYSDLYAMRILPGDTQIQIGRPDSRFPSPLTTNWMFQSHREVFFRNFTLESSLAVHRLGMNIVTYLLTRFDDVLEMDH